MGDPQLKHPARSRIIFLGTGSGNQLFGKQPRATAGIVIQINDNQLHIDPGPGALMQLAACGLSPREHTAILISHAHLGHSNDLNPLIDAMTYTGLDRQGVLVASDSVINGVNDFKPILMDLYKNCLEKVIVIKQDQKVAINEVEIMATKTIHPDPTAIGFKILSSNFTVSYSGDTKYSVELADYYKESDILILNVVSTEKSDTNLTVENAIKLISEVKPQLTIITHFKAKLLEEDPLYQAREIQTQTGIQTIAAKDGMSINPALFALGPKQKTLMSYK